MAQPVLVLANGEVLTSVNSTKGWVPTGINITTLQRKEATLTYDSESIFRVVHVTKGRAFEWRTISQGKFVRTSDGAIKVLPLPGLEAGIAEVLVYNGSVQRILARVVRGGIGLWARGGGTWRRVADVPALQGFGGAFTAQFDQTGHFVSAVYTRSLMEYTQYGEVIFAVVRHRLHRLATPDELPQAVEVVATEKGWFVGGGSPCFHVQVVRKGKQDTIRTNGVVIPKRVIYLNEEPLPTPKQSAVEGLFMVT